MDLLQNKGNSMAMTLRKMLQIIVSEECNTLTPHTHTFRTVVCHVGTSGYLGTPKLQGRQVPCWSHFWPILLFTLAPPGGEKTHQEFTRETWRNWWSFLWYLMILMMIITSSYKCFRVRTWKLVGLKCQEKKSILRIISYIISEQIDCWVLNYN